MSTLEQLVPGRRGSAARTGARDGAPCAAGTGDGTGIDARLVPAALGVWAVTAVGLDTGARSSAVIAVVCGGLALAALAARVRPAAVIALALGASAAAAGATAVRVHVRDASPLRSVAADRAGVSARLRVTGDPRPLTAGFGGPQVAVTGVVTDAVIRGHRWQVADPVLVLAPAPGWSTLVPSQRVTVAGSLRPARGGDLTVAVLVARGPPASVAAPSRVQRAAGRLRSGLRAAAAPLPGGSAGLLPGLVDGDVSGMTPELTADFRTTGLTHLTAVSGANVAIVCGAVLLVVRRWARLGPRSSAVLAGLALMGFVVLARPQPSVLRAAVMGALALVALASGRSRAALPALATSVLVLTFVSPELALSVGFALSVLATGALLLIAPPLVRALRRRGVPLVIAAAVAVPVAAHLVTAPLIAAISGRLSLVAIPANMLAAPAVAPATVLGVLSAGASLVSPWLARGLASLAGWPTRWLVSVAHRGAAVPDASLAWPPGARGALLLAAAFVVVAAVVSRSRPVRHVAAASALGAGLIAFPLHWVSPGWPPAGWLMVACDVGEGDGLVLNAGEGAGVVVDTGTEPAVDDRCLRGLGVTRLPLVIITHLHADHVGGITGALHDRAVGLVVTGRLREPAGAWADLTRAAAARGSPVSQPPVGTRWRVGGIDLEVLAPRVAFHDTHSDPNNSSLIVRARTTGHTILLTGDAEIDTEQAMLRDGVDLRADVLKVGHHGSAYFDPRFLAEVHARLAVISVGAANTYGHPAPSLLAALAADGAAVVRTDQSGDVAVVATGPDHRLSVVSHRSGVRPTVPAGGTGALGPAAPIPGPAGARPPTVFRRPAEQFVPRATMNG